MEIARVVCACGAVVVLTHGQTECAVCQARKGWK